MTALLLAEPEPAVRGFLERQLRNDGFDVVSCERAEQLPRAVLRAPAAGEYVTGESPLEILAWAGGADVASVEFTVDDGDTWHPAARAGHSGRWGWSRWSADLPAGLPRGLRRIAVRATDAGGRTQDWQPEPNRLGYGNNGIHAIEVNLVASPPWN